MTAQQLVDLIDAHTAALVLFARQRRDSPEDVVQEAFCKLAVQAHPPNDPVAWLFRVVRNGSLDARKAERRRKRRESVAASQSLWFHEPVFDGLDAREAVEALKALPEEQREVIVLRLWGGLTLEQIAATCDCSVSSAHRWFDTGIASLREKLGVTPCQKKK